MGVIVIMICCAGKCVVNPVTGADLPVIGDSVLVDPTKGTGAVKVTPAHDPNDYECGLRHKLPQLSVFTDEGFMLPIAGQFAGQSRWQVHCTILSYPRLGGVCMSILDVDVMR